MEYLKQQHYYLWIISEEAGLAIMAVLLLDTKQFAFTVTVTNTDT